jgi:HPt (histidine-containing phosphotransfer) domain-containing protein
VACFVDVAPSLAHTIRASFENGDAEELWRAAHSLKSSCGALGATQLAKQCAQIEWLARQSNLAAVRPLMEDFNRGVTAAIERLQAVAGDVHVLA